jgi:threonine/homoserine/homoserine lactone efflux protein
LIGSLIYQGIIIIIILTFSFGPAFFALINSGIKYGYKTGSFLAFGIILSDFFLCMLTCFLVHLGMESLLGSSKAQTFFAIVGGIVLIVFGAFYFKKPIQKSDEAIDIANLLPKPRVLLLKGFFLNIFNPTVWLLWLANVTAISKTLDYSMLKMVIFFSIVLGAALLVELAKVSLANKIKHYLTEKIMSTVNHLTGIALIIFGMILIYNHYFDKQ